MFNKIFGESFFPKQEIDIFSADDNNREERKMLTICDMLYRFYQPDVTIFTK